MSGRFLLPIAFLISLFFTAAIADEHPDWSAWSSTADILLNSTPNDGIVEFEALPEVLDKSLADLADLRIVESETGHEAAYVVRILSPFRQSESGEVAARLLNAGYVAGVSSSVEADFGDSHVRDGLEILSSGNAFRRKVKLEASDDRNQWRVISEGEDIARLEDPQAPGGIYRKNIVSFPQNAQRYFRVTVYNEASDKQPIRILAVREKPRERQIRERRQGVVAPIIGVRQEEKLKEKATLVELDLGLANLPLLEIKLNFGDGNFSRHARLEGRNREQYIRIIDTENGKLEKKVEEPWRTIESDFVLSRVIANGIVEERLIRSLFGNNYRYLRLRIENGDDSPLHFVSAEVRRLPQLIAFQPNGGKNFNLYFGNPEATAPSYDLPNYIDKLSENGIVEAKLENIRANDAGKPVAENSKWSERNAWLLWVLLLTVVAVLGMLVYRMAKGASENRS